MSSPLLALASRVRQLSFGLVAALVLHALLLSYAQLKRSHPRVPGRLLVRDNTPELLQFASRRNALPTLSPSLLPKARPLPPPAKSRLPVHKRPLQNLSKPETTLPAFKTRKRATFSSRIGQGDDAKERMRGNAALVQERNVSLNQKNTLYLSASDHALLDTYQGLWARAQPLPSGSIMQVDDTDHSVEIRELALASGLGPSVKMPQQQMVVIGSQILLVWKDNDKMFILQVKRDLSSTP